MHALSHLDHGTSVTIGRVDIYYFLAMAVCPSVRLSVTSRCSVEMDGRNNLGFWVLAWGDFF